MTELKIHVQSVSDFFAEARKGACRLDAGDMTPQTPSISFENAEHLFAVLSGNRWALLSRLRETGPSSIRALANALSRDYRGVHSDVTKLIEVGLVEKDESGKVLVPWSKITAEVSLDAAA
jgi:predicted transcriptional regulator